MAGRSRRLVVLCALATLLAAVGLVLGIAALDRYLNLFDDRPFTPAEWATADSLARGLMARDAIREIPGGTTKERVLELLGKAEQDLEEPQRSANRLADHYDRPQCWTYYLGSWCGLGLYCFDSAFLYVFFGSDGRVVSAKVDGL